MAHSSTTTKAFRKLQGSAPRCSDNPFLPAAVRRRARCLECAHQPHNNIPPQFW